MARGSSEDEQELLRLHAGALERFGRLVAEAGAGQWEDPTPCSDWTVRDLVNHVTVEQLWVPAMLAGSSVAEVGDRYDGDVLGDDPAAAWRAAAAAALAAFAEPGALGRTVHLSYGDRPAEGYCREMTVDAVVHGWDLAVGLGADARMAADAAEFALAEVTPYADALVASGLFAPPVAVPVGADVQTRLLGLVGRDATDPFGSDR
ncbi:TIGR03086 family metal-binding protein [Kitasatospora sp. NPDC048365]|uniref:TIGR03086 family metal-binding protein n=1 Tax=Kitasatospora sp. NPDC048365 TaxID=3364050 RepID=UPI00371E304C